MWVCAVALVSACTIERESPKSATKAARTARCTDCHGRNGNPAPPNWVVSLDTAADAHQAHLTASPLHAAIACASCHIVPVSVLDAGHLDTPAPAELTWDGLAVANGAQPTYDAATGTCSNYCHGQTLAAQGSNTQPQWTTVDGSQTRCGTCHCAPPGPPHVRRSDCESCHSEVVESAVITMLPPSASVVFAAPELHVDGILQVDADLACNSCHGTAGDSSGAPPQDTAGNTGTWARGVGAHQAHLQDSDWHEAVSCTTCHDVPANVDAAGHLDTTPFAELSLSGYDAESRSCENACHGDTAVIWTTVDGTQAACGTCHGLPPEGLHVARTDCETCHGGVVQDVTVGDETVATFLAPELHVNGSVEVDLGAGCMACHGSDDTNSSAPALDTFGNTTTSASGVGAHASHLTSSDWHAPVACDSCHIVPEGIDDEGHRDSERPAELAWSGLPLADGAAASYAEGRCTNYCHGATLTDGSNTVPLWTKVDGTQAACGTCHGAVVANAVVGAAGATAVFAAPELHMNGIVEVSSGLACNTCHGSATSDAPPFDASGRVATTVAGVGAHQAHLQAADWHAAIACLTCHDVPTEVSSAGHLDTARPAEVSFSGLADADNVAASYSAQTNTCAVYCHGQTLAGGSQIEPTWTKVDGTQAACGGCHGLPPGGDHPAPSAGTDCADCHGDVVGDGLGAEIKFVAPELHVNGEVEVAADLPCTGCHGAASPEARIAPPGDTKGNFAQSEVGVGAHDRHLDRGVACSECHTVPSQWQDAGHRNGNVDVVFGSLAGKAPADPEWHANTQTCTNSYCHGAFGPTGASGPQGARFAPQWTRSDGTQGACGTCHGLPPTGHWDIDLCGFCHNDVVGPEFCSPADEPLCVITNTANHVDGVCQTRNGALCEDW